MLLLHRQIILPYFRTSVLGILVISTVTIVYAEEPDPTEYPVLASCSWLDEKELWHVEPVSYTHLRAHETSS